MSTGRSRIKAIQMFQQALSILDNQDKALYQWSRNRIALTHALAMHLNDLFRKAYPSISVDMGVVLNKSSKVMNPDILIHNRTTGSQILAVICRNDYLTESEQEELIRFRRESGCEMILALSFMALKNYMLVYVAMDDAISYYHFDRNSHTLDPVRQKNLEDGSPDRDQLTLDRLLKRR